MGIGLGVFLFVLIFKPFPLDHIEFDERKLFVLGLGALVFLVLFIVRIVYPCLMENNYQHETKTALHSLLSGFIIWLVCTVIFSVYLNFAGFVSPSSYLVFKIVLICLAPPLILAFYDKMAELKRQNEALILEEKIIQQKIGKNEADHLNRSIEFIAETNAEKVSLLVKDILFIKSADNYAEIHYYDADLVKKKLVRNTLKNIELQIRAYPGFIRCHRICIVNTHQIEKLNGNCNHHSLILKGCDEEIPVSRQYFLKLKEAL